MLSVANLATLATLATRPPVAPAHEVPGLHLPGGDEHLLYEAALLLVAALPLRLGCGDRGKAGNRQKGECSLGSRLKGTRGSAER